jgi:hypothetical protein
MTFQDDPTAFNSLHQMPHTQLLWASDFPHTDSTWPRSEQLLAEQTSHLEEQSAGNHARQRRKAFFTSGRNGILAHPRPRRKLGRQRAPNPFLPARYALFAELRGN